MEAIIQFTVQHYIFSRTVLQVPFHATVLTIAWEYVGNLGLSYAAALLLSLVFEAPFLNLQKMFGI